MLLLEYNLELLYLIININTKNAMGYTLLLKLKLYEFV